MRTRAILSIIGLAAAGCGAAGDSGQESVGVADEALSNGFEMSPTEHRAVKLPGCSGTVVDPWWVMTARHCLGNDKDPNAVGDIKLGTETRHATHVTLHPKHLERTDVAMLRLDAPFTNIPQEELPIWPYDTDDLIGESVLCTGYGGTGNTLTGGVFTVIEETAYDDPDKFYQLETPNDFGQSLIAGDSGSSCKQGSYITGVHKGAGQVSAEAWRDWVIDRRDCPGFDPNNPTTGFCSEACPCDVGEGDCDSSAQCQPGLYCRSANTAYGLPAGYDVCDRIDPSTCGTFSTSNPQADLCRWSPEEICACTHGEGDCDDDNDCGGSLECQTDSGYAVGLPWHYEICVYPAAPGCPSYNPAVDDAAFCNASCPCDLGQGDCDSNADCRGGLVCASNVGAQFGKPADYDICVKP